MQETYVSQVAMSRKRDVIFMRRTRTVKKILAFAIIVKITHFFFPEMPVNQGCLAGMISASSYFYFVRFRMMVCSPSHSPERAASPNAPHVRIEQSRTIIYCQKARRSCIVFPSRAARLRIFLRFLSNCVIAKRLQHGDLSKMAALRSVP